MRSLYQPQQGCGEAPCEDIAHGHGQHGHQGAEEREESQETGANVILVVVQCPEDPVHGHDVPGTLGELFVHDTHDDHRPQAFVPLHDRDENRDVPGVVAAFQDLCLFFLRQFVDPRPQGIDRYLVSGDVEQIEGLFGDLSADIDLLALRFFAHRFRRICFLPKPGMRSHQPVTRIVHVDDAGVQGAGRLVQRGFLEFRLPPQQSHDGL